MSILEKVQALLTLSEIMSYFVGNSYPYLKFKPLGVAKAFKKYQEKIRIH